MAEEGKSQTYVKTHKAVAAGSPRYSGGLHLQARGGRNSDRHGVDRGGDHSKLRHLQSSADEGFTPPSESPENGTGPSSVQQIHIPGKANAEPNPEPSTPDKVLACSPACAPCQASSESYRPSRGLGYASLVCSPGW